MAELPPAGDFHHGVNGWISGLKIAVSAVQTHPSQILERRDAEMSTKRVLNCARGDSDRRRDIGQADIEVGVVVDERDCPAQRLRLRGNRFGMVPH
jgi:hypothetical protein